MPESTTDITTPTHMIIMVIDRDEARLLLHHLENMWLDRDKDYDKMSALIRKLRKFAE